jgi:hypothetical protein
MLLMLLLRWSPCRPGHGKGVNGACHGKKPQQEQHPAMLMAAVVAAAVVVVAAAVLLCCSQGRTFSF